MDKVMPNRSMVHRVWQNAGTELMASFQYFGAAKMFAQMCADDPTWCPENCFYTATDTYTGEMTTHKPGKDTPTNA